MVMMDGSLRTKCKVLSGSEKVSAALKKIQEDQARKIFNKSMNKSFGSLKKRRQLTALNQSSVMKNVMKQVSSLRKQNQRIIEEIVKLRQYTTKIESLNLQYQGQQTDLLGRLLNIQGKLKKKTAENSSLKQQLEEYQRKYNLKDTVDSATPQNKILRPERIVCDRLNQDTLSSPEESFFETRKLQLSNNNSVSQTPVVMSPLEEMSEEILPSFIYFPTHDCNINSSNSGKADESSSSSTVDQSGLSPKCALPSLHLSLLSECENESDLSLRLPDSPESSFTNSNDSPLFKEDLVISCQKKVKSNSGVKIACKTRTTSSNVLEIPLQKDGPDIVVTSNLLSPCNRVSESPENTVSVATRRKNVGVRRTKTLASEKMRQSQESENMMTHSPVAIAMENHDVSKAPDASTKSKPKKRSALKVRNSNVSKKKKMSNKSSKSTEERNSYDFVNNSKDSFIMNEEKRVKLPKSKSLPAKSSSKSRKFGVENESQTKRSSRRRTVVSYAEPSLGSKLRRGDKHTDSSLVTSFSPKKIK